MLPNSSAASAQLSAPPVLPRLPAAVAGLQVNFCKNPVCANFGVPVAATSTFGRGAVNAYTVVARGKGLPAARCNHCGENFPVKSNQGQSEENGVILRMLVGKMPLRRICEAADVTPPVLYARIDFFSEQARACHNYLWSGDRGKDTPAMRLGLARAPLDHKDIIYFA